MNDCCCCSNDIKEKSRCPICGQLGHSVPYVTVQSLVKHFRPDIQDEDFVCLTQNCDIVYFRHDTVFRQTDVSIPIAWKDGANPKFVCYCNQVTENEVINAVIHGGAKTVKDVIRLTGAMKSARCAMSNPKGVCCYNDIENIVKKSLRVTFSSMSLLDVKLLNEGGNGRVPK